MADNPPVQYSEAIAEKICDHIAGGGTLRALEDMPGMPTKSTVWKWSKRYADFSKALSEANVAGADCDLDNAVYIADTEKDPQKARNMIDIRKHRAACRNPKRYGPKLDMNVTERVAVDEKRTRQVTHAMLRLELMRRDIPMTSELYSEFDKQYGAAGEPPEDPFS